MDHLWEAKHPYYWNEGSYHERGMHERHESWADFIEMMGDADEDLNLVCRFDWQEGEGSEENGIPVDESRLLVFYVAQRKAYTYSHEVKVTREDEPAVRAWLTQKWEHLCRLWAPLSAAPSPPEARSTEPSPEAADGGGACGICGGPHHWSEHER